MRNEASHFSVNPTNLDIGRSRFPRPFDHKTTFNVGELIPFYWTEILPGDTVSMKTSKVVRMSTLIDPVMDNLFLDTYYFFVPMRLVWDRTREFFGENTSGPWTPSTTYTIPQIKCHDNPNVSTGVKVGTVADYMGVPTNVVGLSFSALPIRAYTKIYMDWFIDQMTMTPPNLFIGSTQVNYSESVTENGGYPYLASKLHDYFSSSTPSPQRGPSVALPISGNVPVNVSGSAMNVVSAANVHNMLTGVKFSNAGSAEPGHLMRDGYLDNRAELYLSSDSTTGSRILYSNLVAEWPSDATITLDGELPISVNDIRMAFSMQKWYEKSAMYGGRYIEMLRAQFGVTSPDARLQRSEYLGGNRIPLNVSQVENTTASSASSAQPLGHLGAYSATSDYNDDFTHSFTEHGFLLGICVARYKHSYPQGLERAWSRKTLFDFYFPVFANIGNQPVYKKEIYASGTLNEGVDDTVWGYQEAWAEYRYHPDRTSAYMRPNVSGSLASWHYADNYSQVPFLSSSWMQEDKTMVDRTLAVTSSAAPQLIADIYCDATFVRAMPLYSIPGLIDHH